MKYFARLAAAVLSTMLLFAGGHDLRAQASADSATAARVENRVAQLESSVRRLENMVARVESKIPVGAGGAVAWLFGSFCALWAQNTRRNPWLWFFLGLFFSVIAVLFLLAKNARDTRPKDPRLFSEGRKL